MLGIESVLGIECAIESVLLRVWCLEHGVEVGGKAMFTATAVNNGIHGW